MARKKIGNVRKDKAIFSRTARRTNTRNLPGHNNRRGGTCL